MRQAIIIPTHIDGLAWLDNCLDTIKTDYEIILLFQGKEPPNTMKYDYLGRTHAYQTFNGYDPWAVVYGVMNKIDEFFVLHSSCEVKMNSLFKKCFRDHEGKSVALSSYPVLFGMFLGKYRYEIAKQLPLPIAKDKAHAVDLEVTWNNAYCALEKPVLLFDGFVDNDRFEQKFGRKNMVIENEYIKKYKGTWHRSMV